MANQDQKDTASTTQSLFGRPEEYWIAQSIAVDEFSDYLQDSDTDKENSTLPPSRRWIWVCRLQECPENGSRWTCKTNFLLHLYETPVHRADEKTRTGNGRREISRNWREERAWDFSDEPSGFDYESTRTIEELEKEAAKENGKQS